jgi:hypothetical protein
MSTPTIEGLRDRLEREELNELATKLDKYPEYFEDWKNMTKEDWKEVAGVLAGIQIYNYLNPRREGTEF